MKVHCATRKESTIKALTKRVKFGFGIGDLGGNLYFTIIGFYLLFFFTDIVGLSPALAGTSLLIGKIWDGINDPLIGFLSDRTQTKWGRRRPFLLGGSIFGFLFMGLMFSAPPIRHQGFLFIYLTLLYCLLNTAYTFMNIPYAALLPELTKDYTERTVLNGYRMSFAVLGTFVGAGAVHPIINLASSTTRGWALMGYVMGFIMMVTMWITIWAVREPEHKVAQDLPPFFTTFSQVLRNKVFLLALIPWGLFITGTSMVQGALLYYFAHMFNNEGLFQLALICLLSTSLLFIPIWVTVAKRIGKKRCYMIGMMIMSVGVLTFSLLGELLGPTIAIVIMALTGIGLSTHYVMPHSILPDIVEYDAMLHGSIRREGVFSALWSFASNFGQALALALNGWILALFHYQPNLVTQFSSIGIKLICGPVPVIFYVAGILILERYPIDQAYYEAMIAERA